MINIKKLVYLFCFLNLNTHSKESVIIQKTVKETIVKTNETRKKTNKVPSKTVKNTKNKRKILPRIILKKIKLLEEKKLMVIKKLLTEIEIEGKGKYQTLENITLLNKIITQLKEQCASHYKIKKEREKKAEMLKRQREQRELQEKEAQEAKKELSDMKTEMKNVKIVVNQEVKVVKKIVDKSRKRKQIIRYAVMSLIAGLVTCGALYYAGSFSIAYSIAYGLYTALLFNALTILVKTRNILKNKLNFFFKVAYVSSIPALLYFLGPKTALFGKYYEQDDKDKGHDVGEIFPQQQKIWDSIKDFFN